MTEITVVEVERQGVTVVEVNLPGPQGPSGGLSGSIIAGNVSFSPTGNIAANNVQDAIAEVSAEAASYTAAVTYYVNASTGSDSNSGLTSITAFLTIQKAIDTVVQDLIIPQGVAVSISVANGTYTENVTVRPWIGSGSLTVTGNAGTPSNVVIQGGSGTALAVTGPTPGTLTFNGFKLQATSGTAVGVTFGGALNLTNANFGASSTGHIDVSFGGRIFLGSYTISGNAGYHWHAANLGLIYASVITVTLTGTPAFSYFAGVSQGGTINAVGNTYSGSATGSRFICHNFGTIYTLGTLSELPGNSAGDPDEVSGGFYVTSGGVQPHTGIGLYTIASGAITVTNGFALVDTEGGASTDDLTTINGGTNGEHIYISALDSSHTVVLKDGTGNIQGSGDITLDDANDVVHLIYNPVTSKWMVVASTLAAYQPLDSDLTSWAGVTRASGFDTFAATPTAANFATLVTGESYGLTDAELAALAGLTSAADKLPYFTGSGTAALADLSSAMRTFLTTPSSANLASLVSDDLFSLTDAELAAIAGLTSAANKLPYFTGSGTAALADLSANMRTFLTTPTSANLAALVSDDVFSLSDAELGAIAGLTSAANKLPRFTGSGTADLLDFSTDGTFAGNSDTISPSQKAVKTYVDAADATVAIRTSVRAATTANITIATALNAGDVIDGVTLANGDAVLVKNQTAQAENGIYIAFTSPFRSSNFDTFAKVVGSILVVAEGTVNTGSVWINTNSIGGTIDASAVNFAIRSNAQIGSIAGLTSAADKLPYFTGANTASLADFTTAGRNLVDDANAAAQVTTLGLDNTKIATVGITIDGGGSAITTGVKGYISVPYACTINRARLLADQTGSIVVNVWKDTYANYPPTVADKITASAPPTITTSNKSEDTTLTGWTTAIAADDILAFNVDSATTITRAHLILKVTKT